MHRPSFHEKHAPSPLRARASLFPRSRSLLCSLLCSRSGLCNLTVGSALDGFKAHSVAMWSSPRHSEHAFPLLVWCARKVTGYKDWLIFPKSVDSSGNACWRNIASYTAHPLPPHGGLVCPQLGSFVRVLAAHHSRKQAETLDPAQ